MLKKRNRSEQKIINDLLAKTPVRVQKTVRPLLLKHDWFSKVGTPHPRDFALKRVGSWKKALSTCRITNEAISFVFNQARKASSERKYEQVWNSDRKVTQAFLRHFGMWDRVIQTPHMHWAFGILSERIGLLGAALDLNHPEAVRLCTDMIGLYADGYLPCEWGGKYPHGRWIVF